jgi:hypothetical protein
MALVFAQYHVLPALVLAEPWCGRPERGPMHMHLWDDLLCGPRQVSETHLICICSAIKHYYQGEVCK